MSSSKKPAKPPASPKEAFIQEMKSLHKSKGPGIHGVPKSTKIKELAVILDEQWENMGQTDKWKYEEMQEKA
tara:strand:- start:423 stop:638 length:216 start_codon:yes stop_codon:yes gene_type:complete